MQVLQELKKWLGEVTEIALLLIALGVTFEILFGEKVAFFTGITTNLTGLLAKFGENGMIGLIAMGVIVFLFYRRKTAAEG